MVQASPARERVQTLARGSPHIQGSSRWAPDNLSLQGNLSAPRCLASWMYKVHLGRLPPSELLPSPTARFMTQRVKKNLSTWSKQLISLLGCLRSSNVIIIPTKALVSVRLISTTAADTIIKAPRFLCSKSCTDEAHNVCFGGKTKHGIFPPSTPLLPASFLTEIRENCQIVPHAAGNRPRPMGL